MASPPSTPSTPEPGQAAARAKAVLSQLGGLWQKAPRAARALAVGIVVAVLGAVAWVSLDVGRTQWVSLVENTSREDAAEVVGVLDARGIRTRLRDGGLSVQVPQEQASAARIAAAAAGLPKGGTGFELFDKQNLGQSSFAEQINYRRALQGELARSITALASVESARVHLAMGKRSVFKDADEPPSASVAVRTNPGQTLSPEAVRGIQQLVAASVDGLRREAVTVIDQHGEVLGSEDKAKDAGELERSISARVRSMLEHVVGVGRVAVVTSAVIESRSSEQTEERYDKDGTVLRTESRSIEGPGAEKALSANTNATDASGVAGVQGNLAGTTAPADVKTSTPGRLSESRTFEVSKVTKRTTEPEGRVTRLHLAIMVDFKPGADGEDPQPRDQAEIDQLAAIAREAAGFDEARGDRLEIRSFPFVAEPPPPPPVVAKNPLLIPLAAGGGVLVAIIGFVLWRRRRGAKDNAPSIALPAPLGEVERVLDNPSQAAPALPSPPPLHDRVLDAVRADVPKAARVLSTWLAESPPPNQPAAGGP